MTTTWEVVARDVLDQARRRAGGGVALAAALKSAGAGSDLYSESAVSNWIRGRTRPPAEVVLAAAAIYGLSLDQPLGVAPAQLADTATEEGEDVKSLQAAVAQLEALVRDAATRSGSTDENPKQLRDVRAVFATRSEVQEALPVVRALGGSERVAIMGLSLNQIAQGVSDITLTELVENGLRLRCLFLDPDGDATQAREEDEGHPPGHLSDLTRTNIAAMVRVRDALSTEARSRLEIRKYDETLRFGITVFDYRCLVQVYLPHARGVDSPTFLMEADPQHPHGLFPVFEKVFDDAWESADVID